jgi:disulfide bond formation protein DsbB
MSPIDLVLPPSQTRRALLILLAALAVLAAAWTFQELGFKPCELCFMERYAYYAGAPIAALTAWLASRSAHGLARALFVLLALIFLANAGLAFYHVGVEQHWWQGPAACTGSLTAPVNVNDLAKAINAEPVVRCDEPALRILGLSLAGWNVVASAAIALYAALAARLAGPS